MQPTDSCRECGEEIPTSEIVCPECGYDSRRALQLYAGGLLALGIAVWFLVHGGVGIAISLIGVVSFFASYLTRATH